MSAWVTVPDGRQVSGYFYPTNIIMYNHLRNRTWFLEFMNYTLLFINTQFGAKSSFK